MLNPQCYHVTNVTAFSTINPKSVRTEKAERESLA